MDASWLPILFSVLIGAVFPGDPAVPGGALTDLDLPGCEADFWPENGVVEGRLEAGSWSELEDEAAAYHGHYVRNPACERRLVRLLTSGTSYLEPERDLTSEWVLSEPDSWVAWTYHGVELSHRSHVARGTGRASEIDPTRIERAIELANRAEGALERALAIEGRNPAAWGELLRLDRTWSDRTATRKRWRRAISADPLSVHVRRTAVAAHHPHWGGVLGDADGIVAGALERTHANPRFARMTADAHYLRAEVWHGQLLGNASFPRENPPTWLVRLMISYWDWILRWGEPGSDWHYHRIWARTRLGDHEGALADARLATSIGWASAHIWILEARSLRALSRHDEALEVVTHTAELFPDYAEAYSERAGILASLSRHREAATAFRDVYEHSVSESWQEWALRREGVMWNLAGEHGRAVAAFEAALAYAPDNGDSLAGLAQALLEDGDPTAAEAIEHYLAVASHRPEERGRAVLAQRWLRRARAR